ncbi:TRAP transporter small permease [Marinivivus vitaminiproducens]|uniref:TRAP transporter small permease n=1 Tax=Marinivivus vitaminiproducens TaxID=3035935 RepID=UPI0027A3AF4C|nr:TRAP transporter small permease subunit [Geminicoccaceae bacterium SCSIO 64248]
MHAAEPSSDLDPAGHTPVGRFIAAVAMISTLFGIVAIVLLLAAVVIVCEVVLTRYFLGGSAIWQYEVITYAVIAATFLGSPYVLLTRGHVGVDLVPLFLPRRGRLALALLANLLGFLFCAVIAGYGFVFALTAYQTGQTAPTIAATPLWIPYASLPIGGLLLCLQYIADSLALITGRARPFGLEDENA